MTNYEGYITDLDSRGYAEVPGLPLDTRQELFTTFSDLADNSPDAMRNTRLDGTGRGYGRGGFREVPAEQKEGRDFAVGKHTFIYDPAFRETWADRNLDPGVEDLIELCDLAYSTAVTSVRGIVRALDRHPEYAGFADRLMSPTEQSARLVVMRYATPNEGDTRNQLFGSHRDMSMFSVHMGDTHPGFYFTDTSRVASYYNLQGEKGALFAGKQWDKSYPDSPLQARFHGVALPQGLEGVRRSSAVLFVDELGFVR